MSRDFKAPPPPPRPTSDRRRYQRLHRCKGKLRYATYKEGLAEGKDWTLYPCDNCHGFHRTFKPLDAKDQVHLIEHLFGAPVTPEKITAYNELRL